MQKLRHGARPGDLAFRIHGLTTSTPLRDIDGVSRAGSPTTFVQAVTPSSTYTAGVNPCAKNVNWLSRPKSGNLGPSGRS